MRRCLSWGVLLVLLAPALAEAQSFPTSHPFWEVAVQAGFFVPDEPDRAEIGARELFQARVGYRRATGFGVEAYGAFAPLRFEAKGAPPEKFDLPTLLYGADLVYAWAIPPRTDFFISAGLGGITWIPDRDDLDAESNLRLALGAGLHYLIGSRLALRADLRDHIIFDELADTAHELALADRGDTNNLEGSLGLSFVLP